MLNPYGSDPTIASFQGSVGGVGPHLITTAAYSCVAKRLSAGVFLFTLGTGVTHSQTLVQVTQFGAAPSEVDILMGLVDGFLWNQFELTFPGGDPEGTFNVIVLSCFDGQAADDVA